jgi:hypothetical protein
MNGSESAVRWLRFRPRPAAAHARQDKELVLEFEGLNRFLST